jgi:hypothetical protein
VIPKVPDTWKQEGQVDSNNRLEYPEGKVAGIMSASDVDAATAALREAGFAASQVETITAADIAGIETPIERGGLPGIIETFLLSLGDHIGELERMRRALEGGRTVVAVIVDGDDAKQRAAGILKDHGSDRVKYFGKWSIETLAGPA